jgi:hypothetical protein
MPNRICPKCEATLRNTDYYFCSNCGAALSANLIKKPSVIKTSLYVVSQTPSSKFFRELLLKFHKEASKYVTRKNVFLTFVAVLILLNVFLVLILTNRLPLFSKTKEQGTAVVQPNVLDLGLSTSSQVFGSDSISKYVPKNAGFYLEGFDYKGLLLKYLPENVPYKEVIIKSQTMLGGHFVVFSTKINGYWEWTGIFMPVDPKAIEEELKIVNLGHLKYKLMDDKLVVTTKEEILKDVEDSINQTAINVTLTPAYATTKAKLPKDGQLLIMFLTSDSKEILKQMQNYPLSPIMTSSIDQLIKSGYNEFVIKDLSVKN